jgi:hypothetical protein
VARGGGDGPEAVTAALDNTLNLTGRWRRDAAKVAVVIRVTDAAPHGIGQDHDCYKDGEPDGMQCSKLLHEIKLLIHTSESLRQRSFVRG